MLTSPVTGNQITAFLGCHSFDNKATFGIIKTSAPNHESSLGGYKTMYEIYACNGFGSNIEDDPNNFICDFDPKTDDDYIGKMKAIRYLLNTYKFWSEDKLNDETIETIKKFYNDYYKYTDGFKEVL